MIDFLYRLNKSLSEESNIYISCKKKKQGLIVRVFDFKKRSIANAKVYLNNSFEGFTNSRGLIEINKKISKKSTIKAELGIYYAKKEIMP